MNLNIELNSIKFSEQLSAANYLQCMKQFPILSAEEEYNMTKELFNKVINVLNPREKDILFKRRLSYSPQTLEELSGVYHISKERVRQIELSSIRKLKNNINTLQ